MPEAKQLRVQKINTSLFNNEANSTYKWEEKTCQTIVKNTLGQSASAWPYWWGIMQVQLLTGIISDAGQKTQKVFRNIESYYWRHKFTTNSINVGRHYRPWEQYYEAKNVIQYYEVIMFIYVHKTGPRTLWGLNSLSDSISYNEIHYKHSFKCCLHTSWQSCKVMQMSTYS